jgi:hypothetical protein
MLTVKTNEMKYFISIALLFWTILLYGQTITKEDCGGQYDSKLKRTIYLIVDSMPEFPGGIDSLNSFINRNLTWPDDGTTFQGTVVISMIVEIDGTLTNKVVVRGIYEGSDKEALRLIDIMPRWKIGKCKGKAVPVKYLLPIKFRMNS